MNVTSRMKTLAWILSALFLSHSAYSQSEYLKYLADSLPTDKPVLLNLKTSPGCYASERIALSEDGKELYYGERNGYKPDSTANILKISYSEKGWSEPVVVFRDSSGAPAISPNGDTMYFQHDNPTDPQGLCSPRTTTGWGTPEIFSRTIKHTHYLQSTKSGKYFYSGFENGENNKTSERDIFSVEIQSSGRITSRLLKNP